MPSDDPGHRAIRLQAARITTPVALTLLAGFMLWTQRAEPRRPKATGSLTAPIDWMATPTTSVGFAASPEVTTPAASVARFSVWPLPIVATVVDVVRLREVTLARIGGLYGP